MRKYDYLVVGCGMFGAVFAQKMAECGKNVLVIEKRPHIGGNCYTEEIEGISVHKHGPHIFHTSNEKVWTYVKRFATFNQFINRPKVKYKHHLYSFPINLMTLHQLWGVNTPTEAKKKLCDAQIHCENPKNMEEWLLSKVGKEIYEIFFKGYTTKQWRKTPKEMPVGIIRRLPIRLNFDDNYYIDKFQGIPIDGYTKLFEKILEGIQVKLNIDYLEDKEYWDKTAKQIVYTGKIDEYYNYKLGELEYRGLRFETKIKNGDYQGNAVINYTEERIPYTRVVEHKHFNPADNDKTVVTWEFPTISDKNSIPYYPVNTHNNNNLYGKYQKKAKVEKNLVLGGRLATYRYLDMDDVVLSALQTVDTSLSMGSGL